MLRYGAIQLKEHGPYASTYRCVDVPTGTPRTLRVGPRACPLLRDELAAHLRLRNLPDPPPALPRLCNFHVRDGNMHLVLDSTQGNTVRGMLGAAAPQPARALKAVHDIARAARHAHRHRVLLLDLSLDGIYYSAPLGCFRLEHLANARALAEDEALHASEAVCSSLFASPEVLLRRGAVGPAHDVWMLGVLAYWLLVGEHPFIGFYDGAGSRADATLGNRLAGGRLPAPARPLVSAMLSKDPEERPTVLEVLEDPLLRGLT